MTVPYRTFYRQHGIQIGYHGPNLTPTPDDYSAAHNETRTLYHKKIEAGNVWDEKWCMIKGYTEDGWGLPGANNVMDLEVVTRFNPPALNNYPTTVLDLFFGVLTVNAWDAKTGSGRYLDGVNDWAVYPPTSFSQASIVNFANRTLTVANLPLTRSLVYEAWDEFTDLEIGLEASQSIFDYGLLLRIAAETPSTGGWSAGHGVGLDFTVQTIIARYFNATCNSLSRNTGPAAGGWPLVLTGLGFSNTDSEILSKSGAGNQGHVFADSLAMAGNAIYIEKLDGSVAATLQPGAPWNDYTVDSGSQITIASIPALPVGVYQIRLHKRRAGSVNFDIDSYAGDWRTDPDGRMTPGQRLYLYIYDTYTPPRTPIITTTWTWKKGALTVFKYYAPVDVRATATFWEGMILGISPFTRGISGESHLPLFPDMQIQLDNTSKEFSKLLAEYWCKNQLVEVFFGWQEQPSVFQSLVFRGIVSDYDRPGSQWTVRLRDVLEKYFAVKIPKYRCTVEDFPNIAEDHVGRAMPEVLGLASLTAGDKPGAVEAIYVDTATYKYLAARGSLHAVLEVYADGVLKTETTDYVVSYEDGGRTYITFTADQGTNKITFNAEGYTYEDWDSANGYVQNPAYIVLFLLAFFTEIPDINVDIPAFDDEAAIFELLGFGEAGFMILQDSKAASDYLQELMFTYGLYHWIKGDGKITIGRKDVTDFATAIQLFQQIDALEEARKPVGFAEAVNSAVVSWGYFPTANQFTGAKSVSRASSIAAFEAEIQPASDWNFPWTTSEALVDLRAQENLLRLGFGNQSIEFPLSTKWLSLLDIFTNFKFQDPWGINRTGGGDIGKLFFIESMTPDLLAGRVEIKGADLQWLLRQYIILGDEDVIPDAWASATEEDRMYAYLCDELTDLMADGEPGKELADENLGE